MSLTPRDSYLETQILTATPQKLRLMLIDGAIRKARQTLACWEEQRNEEAYESLSRCRGIIAELLGDVRTADDPLAAQVSAIYLFLFQTLAEAQFERSAAKVASALKVLEVEQGTWQQVCEQMPEAPRPDLDRQPQEITGTGLAAILPSSPHIRGRAPHYHAAASKFSMEG